MADLDDRKHQVAAEVTVRKQEVSPGNLGEDHLDSQV